MRDSTGLRRGARSNALWGSGSRGESRKNALWGSGKRANALWGRRGRGLVLLALAAFTLVVPLAAGAKSSGPGSGTFISPGLLEKGKQDPAHKLHVIIKSTGGTKDAIQKINGLGAVLRRPLSLIGAIAVDIPAGKLDSLSKQSGLTVTPDASVHVSGTVN